MKLIDCLRNQKLKRQQAAARKEQWKVILNRLGEKVQEAADKGAPHQQVLTEIMNTLRGPQLDDLRARIVASYGSEAAFMRALAKSDENIIAAHRLFSMGVIAMENGEDPLIWKLTHG